MGRIYDWYKKSAADQWNETACAGVNDPGVQSVTAIYNYFKARNIETEVMGASFRNAGQIVALAGCDLLTISPELLHTLSTSEEPITRQLSAEHAQKNPGETLPCDEVSFRYLLNDSAMATEKLAEGIRVFINDAIALDQLLEQAKAG